MKTEKYNGWTNYETWNIALWLSNDEGLYHIAKNHKIYSELIADLRELGSIETPDGVAYNDSGIDRDEINKMLADF
jgi:hypothetical protein